MLTVFKYWRY